MSVSSLDIIIPSFRPAANYLLPILNLAKPPDIRIRYFLVVDNPTATIPESIKEREGPDLNIIHHQQNQGAAVSRNDGIEAGHAPWMLFLDDDILVPENLLFTYIHAIATHPQEIGFIGLIRMPAPGTAFTEAIRASGSMDIFTVAEKKENHAWGATANIMIRRSALGDIRFSELYPRAGGGEDIDFFLKVRAHNHYRNFKSLPEAAVLHPWWNQEKVNIQRPFRYGIGGSWLAQLNPQYVYYDLLNTPELLLLLIFGSVAAAVWKPQLIPGLLFILLGIIIVELVANMIQALKRRAPLRPAVFFYVLLLRLSFQSGLLWGNLSRGRLTGMGERFNDDGKIRKLNFYRLNSYKITKWIGYPLVCWLAFRYWF
ncbi:GT2 family glycosyltransferase [Chitinophaga dinghuensis]|uniref:GT2 family glycosyltransferase n=1 Tax=Chitinophaga dinghuensis TaxID=1539050 RepID=A0A327VTW7_9BACT|nr:glycosyltransferase [Chitinophaga dinghuensis]RAJ77449.1 GT2 family glycosyltransferase [Chitinophaga dinghuensis]